MRITQIMLAKGFGGAERSFIDLALALAERGHVIQAICHRDFSRQAALAQHPRIEVQTIPVLSSWDPLALRRISRALRAFAPAVVHAHLARAAHLGGQAARRCEIPNLVKTHTNVSLKYYRHVDHFVATTRTQQAYLLEHGISGDRICIIPNFSAVRPAPPRAANAGPRRLLGYGRMVHKKGFDALLRAAATLIGQGADIELQLGGDGPERRRLEQLAAVLGIAERVAFIGWVEDVREHLLAADLFILPSREEPFGIAVLEAMACHTPILATRCAGPLEILDEATAVLTEPDDIEGLTAALRGALSAPELSRRHAATAAEKFERRYSPDAVVPEYLALYQALTE